MVVVYPRLILLTAGAGLLLASFALRFDPRGKSARALRSCVTGLFLLLAWNLLPLPHLGVNPLSAWLAGSLGLPGAGLLAVLARLP